MAEQVLFVDGSCVTGTNKVGVAVVEANTGKVWSRKEGVKKNNLNMGRLSLLAELRAIWMAVEVAKGLVCIVSDCKMWVDMLMDGRELRKLGCAEKKMVCIIIGKIESGGVRLKWRRGHSDKNPLNGLAHRACRKVLRGGF